MSNTTKSEVANRLVARAGQTKPTTKHRIQMSLAVVVARKRRRSEGSGKVIAAVNLLTAIIGLVAALVSAGVALGWFYERERAPQRPTTHSRRPFSSCPRPGTATSRASATRPSC